MVLRVPYLALAVLAMAAGVFSGAQEAWPKQPPGNPQALATRAAFFQPSN